MPLPPCSERVIHTSSYMPPIVHAAQSRGPIESTPSICRPSTVTSKSTGAQVRISAFRAVATREMMVRRVALKANHAEKAGQCRSCV
jgi:hypothetical protein